MRAVRAVAVVLLVVFAGCAAPLAAENPNERPDVPPTDVQGWENGYWYDDAVAVDESDGLDDDERRAVVSRAMARVERIRGIEFGDDVEVRVITREEWRQQVTGGSGGDGPSGEDRFQETKHRALFLVGDQEDATEREQENDAETVQGYYDTREDEIVIVADGETPVIDEVTLAEELFHAYQFRNLIPERLPSGSTDDTVTAWVSVVEGDAGVVTSIYAENCSAEWDCVREDRSGDGGEGSEADDGPGVHMGIYLLQYFPYADGEAYVRSVREDGGWEAVDAIYEDMPASTATVIHGSADDPRWVRVEDRSSEDWQRVERPDGRSGGTVGQYGIATMFAYTLYDDRNGSVVERDAFLNLDDGEVDGTNPLNYGIEPAAGWNGDRLYAYRDDAGRSGYVWRIAWENESEAEAFVEAYAELLEYRGANELDEPGTYRIDSGPFAGAYRVERRGEVVTIVSGPDRSSLRAIHPSEAGRLSGPWLSSYDGRSNAGASPPA